MDRFAVEGGDAAVAEDEFLAVSELLLGDAVGRMDLVDRAIRRRERKLGIGEDWIGRVVRLPCLEIEKAVAGSGQFGTR